MAISSPSENAQRGAPTLTWTLVLGGARSGKSAYALRTAAASGRALVMIATAQAFDDEMADRIARHRAERGDRWRTLEAPLDLTVALAQVSTDEMAVVDCLTLWVSNLIHAERNLPQETDRLVTAMRGRMGSWSPTRLDSESCPTTPWLACSETRLGVSTKRRRRQTELSSSQQACRWS